MRSRVPGCAVGRLVWGLSMLALPSVSWAQDRFEVPAECGSPAELDDAWTKLLARPSARTRPSVELTSRPEGYRLRVASDEGPRELSAPDCRALFRAAVLIVAVAMAEDDEQAALLTQISAAASEDPSSAPAAPAAPGPTEEKPPAAPAKSATRTPESAKAPRRTARTPWSFAAELAAGVVVGLIPDLNAAGSLALGAKRGAWGLKAGASYVLPRQRLNRAEQGVRVDALGTRLLATLDPHPAWALALGFEASAVRGQGSTNLRDRRSDSIWLWGPRAEGHWRPWRGQHVDLDLGLACTYFVARASFRFDDGTLVYATSQVVGEAWLGVHWRIP